MNPSENTVSVKNAPSGSNIEMGDVHTKDAKDSAAALVATPEQNVSNPDHRAVTVEGENLNDDNGRPEDVTEDGNRTGDVVVKYVKEFLRGGGKVMLEIADGKTNIFFMSRNGDPLKVEVTGSAGDIKLSQVALTLCAQVGAVFVGNALNKQPSPSSCSCEALASPSLSPSPSHSDFPGWITVTVTASNLIGFVFTLIAMSLENQKSSPPKRKMTFSSVAGKFGLAAAASAIIVSSGAALPLGITGSLAFVAVASLPSLVAVALA